MAALDWVTGIAYAAGGSRHYKLWIPTSLERNKPAPLLVMLHGCTHDACDMAEISGMNDVADAKGFMVAYPEQSRLANLLKCWNWFEPNHQSRDSGEPSILAAIVADVCARYNVDPQRVYVAGISAGGAMAVIAGATYPDVFAGIAVAAGGEFKAATSVASAFGVLKHGGPDPAEQGRAAFEAMKDGLARRPRRRMPVIVFQGVEDKSVHPINADQLIAQWGKTNACLATEFGNGLSSLSEKVTDGKVQDGYEYRRHVFSDHDGRLLMEKWMVQGLGHAWPGSPKKHHYGDPKGPNASTEIWRFFNEV